MFGQEITRSLTGMAVSIAKDRGECANMATQSLQNSKCELHNGNLPCQDLQHDGIDAMLLRGYQNEQVRVRREQAVESDEPLVGGQQHQVLALLQRRSACATWQCPTAGCSTKMQPQRKTHPALGFCCCQLVCGYMGHDSLHSGNGSNTFTILMSTTCIDAIITYWHRNKQNSILLM